MVTPLSAHTVEQLFMTFEKKEHDWSIKITFDAGYALPELRDDATSPQPQRAWLVAKNTQQHQRLRDEASKYIYATLTVSHGGKQLPYTISFPDYQSSPPSFPVLLNGGAYFNTIPNRSFRSSRQRQIFPNYFSQQQNQTSSFLIASMHPKTTRSSPQAQPRFCSQA